MDTTVVQAKCLYAAETILRKGLSKIEKERKFLGKILGPKKTSTEFIYQIRKDQELYKKLEKKYQQEPSAE